ncbi:unnamed protein product [Calypogeia fissa]
MDGERSTNWFKAPSNRLILLRMTELEDLPIVGSANEKMLGLGAKYLPHSKVAATMSPVEKKLRAMTGAKKQQGDGRDRTDIPLRSGPPGRRDHHHCLRLGSRPNSSTARCGGGQPGQYHPIPPLKQLTTAEPTVVQKLVKAFAPAAVANLGPGYDFLGCTVEGLGEFVTAEVNDNVAPGTVAISSISGAEGRLSYVTNV